MKKHLMLVAAGLLAASYMDAATVYFDNTGTGWDKVYGYNWSHAEASCPELSSVEIDGHTLYVLDTDQENVIFRSSDSEWADAKQTADLKVVDGAVYGAKSIKSQGGDIDPIAKIVDGSYVENVVVPSEFDEMYLVGAMTSWGKSADYRMQTEDGVTYTLNVPAMTNEEFKFFGGAWGTRELTGAGTGIGDGTYELKKGSGNMSLDIPEGDTKDVTFTLTKTSDDWSTASLKIEGVGEVAPDEFTAVYLLSDRNGFQESAKLKMATTDGITYTLNLPDAGSDVAFKFLVKTTPEKYFSNGQQNIHNGEFTLDGDVTANMTLHTGGNVTFTLTNIDNFSSIKVNIEGQDHDADPFPPIYLVGDMNSWEAEEAYRLQTTDGETYTLTVNMKGDDNFKFLGDDAHNYYFSCGRQNMPDGTYELNTLGSTGDMSLDNGGNVTFTFVLGELHQTATLTIAGQGEDVPDEYPEMYLTSQRYNWGARDALKMQTEDGITYTLTVPDMSTQPFKFFGGDWGIRELTGAGNALENGEYTLRPGSDNMTLGIGGNVTFTLVQSDDFASAKLTIEGQEGEVKKVISYALHGQFNSETWTSIPMNAVDGEEGVYSASFTPAYSGGQFGVQMDVNGNQEEWYKEDVIFSASNPSATLTKEAETEVGINCKFDFPANVKYTATFNANTLELSFSGFTVNPDDPDEPATLYATGDGEFTNGTWNPAEPDVFTYADGKYTLTVNNLTQIKISTTKGDPENDLNAWDLFNEGVLGCEYGDTPGVAVNLVAGYDANIKAPWKGDYTITVSGDLSTITLSTETPKPVGPVTIYLRGEMNSYGVDEAWAMEEVTEGQVWKFVCAEGQNILEGEKFKLADADWNEYNVGGNGNPITLDKLTEVYNGGNTADITLSSDWNGVCWFNLDEAGRSLIAFSNDKDFVPDWSSYVETPDEPEYPSEIYLIGNIASQGWDPRNGVKLEYDESMTMYIAEAVDISGPDGSNGYFSFCTQLATTSGNNAWNELGIRYAADGELIKDDEVDEDEPVRYYGMLQTEDPDAAFEVEPGTYAVMVNLQAKYVILAWMGPSTGISDLAADAEEAIYFNLQGVRVKNPESGLYIKVVNGKSEKVLVK